MKDRKKAITEGFPIKAVTDEIKLPKLRSALRLQPNQAKKTVRWSEWTEVQGEAAVRMDSFEKNDKPQWAHWRAKIGMKRREKRSTEVTLSWISETPQDTAARKARVLANQNVVALRTWSVENDLEEELETNTYKQRRHERWERRLQTRNKTLD
jgi:hypothetical protein